MRKAGIILIVLLIIQGCVKDPPVVSFNINTIGFDLETAFLDTGRISTYFSQKISGGIITFTNDQQSYIFGVQRTNIDEFDFVLPVGEYFMEVNNPEASIYGQARGTFTMEPGNVSITELTDTISIQVKPNCSLFLVSDELDHLDYGVFMIERHSYSNGYFTSDPLSVDSISGLYYTYFTPDLDTIDPSAFLWFYEDKPGEIEGGLPTSSLETGYEYFIRILD